MSEWTAILDDLTAFLRWRQECGVRTEELPPETMRTLLADAPTGTGAGGAAGGGRKSEIRSPKANDQAPPQRIPALPAGIAADEATPESIQAALAALAKQVAACDRCGLCRNRTHTVPGQGNPLSPDILFVGEAPGADEDAQGLAFVGAAGQLLTKMIVAMGYTRDQVFIANICKCRPPGNRPPTADEMQACIPYLRAQIAIVRPKTIVALGATAVRGLLESNVGISRLRGIWTTYAGIPLMPTFHPAYLLRFPPAKRDAWEDLKQVLKRLGKPVPERKTPAADAGA